MGSLVGPEDGFALWAVLLGLAAFGFWCERRAWGVRYSGVMLVIAAAIVLSNLRVIPFASPVYDVVWDRLVPVAIALLLLQADLGRILRESGPTLMAFAAGAATVVAGVVLGVALLPLGELEAELGGIFAATYIGGSLNFAAVSEATGARDGALLSAAVAADNIVTNLHFLALLALPSLAFVTRFFARAGEADVGALAPIDDPSRHRVTELDVPALLAALALAFAIVAVADGLTAFVGAPQYAVLGVTVLAVAFGTLAPGPAARLTGCNEAGNALLLVFLATIGATAEIMAMVERAPVLFAFALVIVAVHTAGVLLIGRVLRVGLRECIVASAACVGGPASAVAIASARDWRDLATPAVLAGSLGYAVGSFVGVFLAGVLA
jgi:uncharacterized membrane protein